MVRAICLAVSAIWVTASVSADAGTVNSPVVERIKSAGGSASWDYRSPNLGPGIKKGFFGDRYGWNIKFASLGSVGANVALTTSLSSLALTDNTPYSFSIDSNQFGKATIQRISSRPADPPFTLFNNELRELKKGGVKGVVGANFNTSNKIEGEICGVFCGSFNRSLGSPSMRHDYLLSVDTGARTLGVLGETVPISSSVGFSYRNLGVTLDFSDTSSIMTGGTESVYSHNQSLKLRLDVNKTFRFIKPSGEYNLGPFGIASYDILKSYAGAQFDFFERTAYRTFDANRFGVRFTDAAGKSVSVSVYNPSLDVYTMRNFLRPGDFRSPHGQIAKIGDGTYDLSGIQVHSFIDTPGFLDRQLTGSLKALIEFEFLQGKLPGFSFGPAYDYDKSFELWNGRLFSGTQIVFSRTNQRQVINYRGESGRSTFDVSAAAAVPEPSSWAMLIVGFGLIGTATRHRGTKPEKSIRV